MIELRGEITQYFGKDRKLVFKSDIEIVGEFGATVWWIPIGKNLGFKIYNKNSYRMLEQAQADVTSLSRKWNDFFKRAHFCREHLPLVYDWLLINYTGHYIRGGHKKKYLRVRTK
jgi:hypothetical protein